MIIIVAKVTLREGRKKEFKSAAQGLIEGSRKEAGNISYDLFDDIEDEGTVAFIEEWKDMQAIDFHNGTSHFKEGVKAIEPYMKGMVITKYSKK